MADDQTERHVSDGWLIVPFATAQAFEEWLDARHEDEPGLWVKFAKKGRGIASVSQSEATVVAMCFGWVDSKLNRYDDDYYVLRYQPRRPRSNWSAGNQALARQLIAEGRMRPAGLAQVEAAQADGRWDAS
ncbi:MAG TPA: hypothetical protein VGL63_05635 [Streptosporangiaceae bacterium]|jgi:uncharacterized protein YdeI (YjbR/CyaY-like superfamily)